VRARVQQRERECERGCPVQGVSRDGHAMASLPRRVSAPIAGRGAADPPVRTLPTGLTLRRP